MRGGKNGLHRDRVILTACVASLDGLSGALSAASQLAKRYGLGPSWHRSCYPPLMETRGQEVTRVEDIVVQVGRSAIFTPVALLRKAGVEV
jgi:hypothetical protein